MNFDNKFIQMAINESNKSEEPLKCGVVIVRDNKIISKAFNSQRSDKNATAHAEIKAIAKAGKKIQNKNLENSVIYCSCEPCTMCLSAMVFAKIEKLVYHQSLREVSPELIEISTESFLKKSPYKFEVQRI